MALKRATAFLIFTTMQTHINYTREFSIPKKLPHALIEEEESDIFDDNIRVINGELLLSSRCGETRFRDFRDEGEYFVIPAGACAQYRGAYAAVNAVWGIEFPPCEFGSVESSWGIFPTMEGYRLERKRRDAIHGADAATIAGLQALRKIQWAVTCAIRDGFIDEAGTSLRSVLAELADAVAPGMVTAEDCDALCASLGFRPATA